MFRYLWMILLAVGWLIWTIVAIMDFIEAMHNHALKREGELFKIWLTMNIGGLFLTSLIYYVWSCK